jgi:hypothetical protein
MGQARSIVSQLKDGLDFAERPRAIRRPKAKEGGDMGEVSFETWPSRWVALEEKA